MVRKGKGPDHSKIRRTRRDTTRTAGTRGMKDMKRILVATGGSQSAAEAVVVGVDRAAEQGGAATVELLEPGDPTALLVGGASGKVD